MPSTLVYLVLPSTIARFGRILDVLRRIEIGFAGADSAMMSRPAARQLARLLC